MDTGLVALVVLGTFATVHERMIEVIRRVFRGPAEYLDNDAIADGFDRHFFRQVPKDELLADLVPPPSPGLIRRVLPRRRWKRARKILDGLTIGPWSVLLAILLALGTRASVLALFTKGTNGTDAAFFSQYLDLFDQQGHFWLFKADLRALLGCILMGLSTALGSRFWHDLSNGLVDLRDRAKKLPAEARKVLPPPEAPPQQTVTQAAPEKAA
jgi:hypothetical protein